MAVNIHITIIELNALHTKRQNLFQELDAVIHLLMEAKHWGLRKSRNATSLNSRFKSLDTLKVKIISVTDRKSGSAGMPRPISYAVFCLKKKKFPNRHVSISSASIAGPRAWSAGSSTPTDSTWATVDGADPGASTQRPAQIASVSLSLRRGSAHT